MSNPLPDGIMPANDVPTVCAREELLTLEGIAELLRVSPQTVRRWRKGEGCGALGPFPEPDAWAGTHPRWLGSSVDGWSGSSRRMHRVIVGFELPRGETLDGVVRDFRRIVEGSVGANYRLRVLPRTDGSSPIEIAWPISSNVSPRHILVCLSLSGTLCPTFSVRCFGACFARIRRSPACSRKRIRRRCEGKAAADRLLLEAW